MHPNHSITVNASLNEQELKEAHELAHLCEAFDESAPLWYPYLLSETRTEGSNLLYYEKKTLVGFLSVYFFYKKACEITLMVLPAKRKKGIAAQLIKTILPLLEKMGVEQVIFSPSNIAKEWLLEKNFSYDMSEYKMQRNSYEPILTRKQVLTMFKATSAHITQLCKIDKLCFNQNKDMTQRFTQLIKNPRYSIFIAYKGFRAVGKAHIQWFEDHASFFDIAIKPKYQGRGLGTELLSFCINEALKQGKEKIYLDVEAKNQQALLLYTRQGFKTTQRYDYWSINFQSLQSLSKAMITS